MLQSTGISRDQAVDAARVVIGYCNTFALDNRCREQEGLSWSENHEAMKPQFEQIHQKAVEIIELLDGVTYLHKERDHDDETWKG